MNKTVAININGLAVKHIIVALLEKIQVLEATNKNSFMIDVYLDLLKDIEDQTGINLYDET